MDTKEDIFFSTFIDHESGFQGINGGTRGVIITLLFR